MSVPAANALSPPPVIRIALTERSWFAWLQISARRSYMAKVRALRACGRLKVTYATPSRTSWRSSSVIPKRYPEIGVRARIGVAHAAKRPHVRLPAREGRGPRAGVLRADPRFQARQGTGRGRGLPVCAGHRLLPLPDPERRDLERQPGVLAGARRGARSGRAEGEGGVFRRIRRRGRRG